MNKSKRQLVSVMSSVSGEINEFVESLTFPQLEVLGDWYDKLPKLNATVEWKCKTCSEENKTKLEGIQNFF